MTSNTFGLESLEILKAYGITVEKSIFEKNIEVAIEVAKVTDYPLAMKIVSALFFLK